MDKLLLLTVCLKEELYESLIYICLAQKDYITPIVKLWGIKYSNDQLLEQPFLENDKKNALKKTNRRIRRVIYFYLRECLMGRNTEYGNNE